MHEREALGIVFLISLSCVNVSRGDFHQFKILPEKSCQILTSPGDKATAKFLP